MSLTAAYTKGRHPTVALDIETGPDPDALEWLLADPPAFSPPKHYKDPQKIADHVAAKRDEWLRKTKAEASLDPLTGMVVSIAFAQSGGSHAMATTISDSGSERLLIQSAFEVLSDIRCVVTFNGTEFDLPFLLVRAARYGITLPHWIKDGMRRYSTIPHCDVRGVLSAWNPRRKGTLAVWYRHLFGEVPPVVEYEGEEVNGAMVARLIAEQAWDVLAEYNAADAGATLRIYSRLDEIGAIKAREHR